MRVRPQGKAALYAESCLTGDGSAMLGYGSPAYPTRLCTQTPTTSTSGVGVLRWAPQILVCTHVFMIAASMSLGFV